MDGILGTGLARMNTVTGEIKYFVNEPENPASLSYNDVWTIYEDSQGRIWIGTWGGGLNLFNETGKNFIRFEADGLISNNINCISESQDRLNRARKQNDIMDRHGGWS